MMADTDPSNEVEEEDLLLGLPYHERVECKNWKVRAKAYEGFASEVESRFADESSLRQLGQLVVKITADSNQNALDCGLDGVLLYFDKVSPQITLEFVDKVANNIIDKCFGSSKQSTIAKARNILQLLIEIHEPNNVVPILISKLSDKKPKIPPACMDMITEGIMTFGSAKYPIKDLIKSLPAAMNGSNQLLRDAALKLIVELHKWIGAAPLQSTLDALRPAQQSEIEKLVKELPSDRPMRSRYYRSEPPPTVASESQRVSCSDVPDAREFVDEIDISKKLRGTEFNTLLASEKWVDQSQALQILTDAIGLTPKIRPGTIIHDIIKSTHELLKNGHIQVQIKILRLIALFADGLRSKFTADIRPIMHTILSKSKDKKACTDMEATCLMLFKYSVSMESQMDDMCEILASKKSPPNAKISIATIIATVISNSSIALSWDKLKLLSEALVANSEDPDGKVREESVKCLIAVCSTARYAEFSVPMLRSMEMTAPKLFRRVKTEMESDSVQNKVPLRQNAVKPQATSERTAPVATDSQKIVTSTSKNTSRVAQVPLQSSAPAAMKRKLGSSTEEELDSMDDAVISYEDALEQLGSIGVNCDQVIGLLNSIKWQEKVEAMCKLRDLSSNSIDGRSLISVLALIGHCTNGFKISNLNVFKAAVDCFAGLIPVCSDMKCCRAVTTKLCDIIGDKFGDKKLQLSIDELLVAVCQTVGTGLVVRKLNKVVENIKSPVVHQSYLVWLKDIVLQWKGDFPVVATIPLLMTELENKQAAVRTASIEVLVSLYSKIGPPIMSMISQKDISSQLRTTLEQEFEKVGYSPVAAQSLLEITSSIPRQDIANLVDKSTLTDLVTVEGKDSWQARKSALEKIVAACEGSGHFLEYSKTLVELCKLLKLRLTDTQSNLKPVAINAFAHIIASLELDKACKILKVYAAAILEGLEDNKKQMRDATVAALTMIVTLNSQQVEKSLIMQVLLSSTEVLKSVNARQELVPWFLLHKDQLCGDCSDIAPSLVSCLQDKSSTVRSSTEACISHFMQHGLISKQLFERLVMDLPPASKRSIQSVIDRVTTDDRVCEVDHSKKLREPDPAIVIGGKKAHSSDFNASVPVETIEQMENCSDDDAMSVDEYVVEGYSKKSVQSVIESISWPTNPSNEDYLHLLSEWQMIRDPISLDMLFGELVSDTSLREALNFHLDKDLDEIPLLAFWLSYWLTQGNVTTARQSLLLEFAASILLSLRNFESALKVDLICCVIRSVLISASRWSHQLNGELFQKIYQAFRRSCDAQQMGCILLITFDVSHSESKGLCAEWLNDYFSEFGIAYMSRIQVTQLFQKLSIDAKLVSAAIKLRLKRMVETLLARIGDINRLVAVLKWEPKELMLSLGIPYQQCGRDDNGDQTAILLSKCTIALNVLNSCTNPETNIARIELRDCLRQWIDSIDGRVDCGLTVNLLDSIVAHNFFLHNSLREIVILVQKLLLVLVKQHIDFPIPLIQLERVFLSALRFSERTPSADVQLKKLSEISILQLIEKSGLQSSLWCLFSCANSSHSITPLCIRTLWISVVDRLQTDDNCARQCAQVANSFVSDRNPTADGMVVINSLLKIVQRTLGDEKFQKLIKEFEVQIDPVVLALCGKSYNTKESCVMKNNQLASIFNELTTSVDKISAVRKISQFAADNPGIDVQQHISKLPSTYKRFIAENSPNLMLQGSQERCTIESTKCPEILKVPESFSRDEVNCDSNSPNNNDGNNDNGNHDDDDDDDEDDDNEMESDSVGPMKCPPQSPFAAKSKMVRDSLSALTKSLDLPVDLFNTSGLGERLQKLKSQQL